MEPTTRRSFLIKGSTGAVATAGLLSAGVVLGNAQSGAEPALSAEELDELDKPMVIHVKDAAAGEVEVFVDEREVVFTDKSLVAKVLRATR